MKYIKGSTVSACLFILSVFVAFPTNDHRILAQSALHPVWIYSIITTDDARDIVKSDAYGNMPPSIIYVVPNKPKSTFGELVPQEELNFANQYYKQQGVGTADYLSALYPDVYSVSIKPSPSRQSVAINIIYRLCVNPDNFVCFGSSQLVTVFADTHQVTTLWNVGLHNENYVVCFAGLSNVDLYKMIDKIEWMSNEKAIVVSFTGPPHCFVPGADRPIFVVTIDNKQVIYAGKAIVWDVSKADNDIMELSELSNASGVSLNLIHTDLQMKTVSTKMFLFDSLFLPLINSSIIKLGDQILLNAPERESTAGLILTSFGTRLYPHMSRMTVPQEIQSASTGEESPDGTQAVHRLTHLLNSGFDMEVALISFAQHIVQIRSIRLLLERWLDDGNGLTRLVQDKIKVAQHSAYFGIVGMLGNAFFKGMLGLLPLTLQHEHLTDATNDLRVCRIERRSMSISFRSCIELMLQGSGVTKSDPRQHHLR